MTQKVFDKIKILKNVFIPALHQKFKIQVSQTSQFESLIYKLNGNICIDHGATRTFDPKTFSLIKRIGSALGLDPHHEYSFPKKKIYSIDLQTPNEDGFKWFSSLIDYKAFPKDIVNAIEETNYRHPLLPEKSLNFLEKIEISGFLEENEAYEFVNDILYKFCSNNGNFIKRKNLEIIQSFSQKIANAILIGPDFNHIAYSLNHIGIQEWYGTEIIEVLKEFLIENGFTMTPSILGDICGPLRQTSTLAEHHHFWIKNENNQIEKIFYPSKFLEFIQRKPENEKKFKNGKINLFQGFLKDF